MKKIELNKIYIPSDKVVSRLIEDELIIVPIESDTIDFDHTLFSLTKTGREIWERLDKETTVQQICTDFSKKYNASIDTISADVVELLEDLLKRQLILPY